MVILFDRLPVFRCQGLRCDDRYELPASQSFSHSRSFACFALLLSSRLRLRLRLLIDIVCRAVELSSSTNSSHGHKLVLDHFLRPSRCVARVAPPPLSPSPSSPDLDLDLVFPFIWSLLLPSDTHSFSNQPTTRPPQSHQPRVFLNLLAL